MKSKAQCAGWGSALQIRTNRPTVRARLLSACLALLTVGLAPAPAVSAQTVPRTVIREESIPPPAVGSSGAILVDGQSGKVLWAKDDRSSHAPASLTKILTALVVLEHADLKSRVTITPEARAAAGSRTYAEAGWTFTVEDLLYGLMLSSGNDAAIALAQGVSPDGTVAGFMRMANRKAAAMGALHTVFVNPHGLDGAGHLTTPRDMALIAMTAMRNPTFSKIVRTQRHRVVWGDGTSRSFRNHNKMLDRYPGTIGVKTGYTGKARHTLVSAVQRGDSSLLAVTLGAPKQYDDATALFDWGFANLPALRAASADEIWPARPPVSQPAAGGSNLIGDTLRLLGGFGGTTANANLVSAGVLGLSSVFAGSLVLVFLAVRHQRRIRPELGALRAPASQAQPSRELPYVSH